MIQGILYSGTMVLIWIIGVISTIAILISKESPFAIGVIYVVLAPLQGLFDLFIYLIPVFRKRLKLQRQRREVKNKEKIKEMKLKSDGNTSKEEKREVSAKFASHQDFNIEEQNEDGGINDHCHHAIFEENENDDDCTFIKIIT